MSGNRSGALPDRRARPDKRHAPFRSRYYCAAHELGRNFPDLIERLRYRAMGAKVNGNTITMGLHTEAADAIEELCAALSEDRQLRWHLRARLDAALSKEDSRAR